MLIKRLLNKVNVRLILLAYNACSFLVLLQRDSWIRLLFFCRFVQHHGMTFCLHCPYIRVLLNNKEPKRFKLKSVISVMPIKPAHAFQREGEGVIKARENA